MSDHDNQMFDPDQDFWDADISLTMFDQVSFDNRDELLDYALNQGLQWALPVFLERRGRLDEDWVQRLRNLRERLAHQMH